ncbi:hypothetical protein IFM89_028791 [Coptis chinensis]|uniref:15-cis-phytoene synthase n=1 Tax=Coptis chinensis TaxID=261450 RepID=A0A835LJR1_9MAGN|nr:hypothetical protein IFM89_028791 [Coptis chinensis]
MTTIVSPKESLSCVLRFEGVGLNLRNKRRGCSFVNFSPGYSVLRSEVVRTSEEKVYEVVLKQAALVGEEKLLKRRSLDHRTEDAADAMTNPNLLNEAYDRCGESKESKWTIFIALMASWESYMEALIVTVRSSITKKRNKLWRWLIMNSGTLLMTPERQRAIWAIYVWCRRTDELVDGPNASHITPMALDRWEQRLVELFEGRPYDLYDAALSHTVSKYPIDIQPFKDMIDGMRLDLKKARYKNFDELYLYCYYVAGTVGLMSVPVMGIAPNSKASAASVYNAALALGIANQLTNILRDVGEDARRGRIYLPLDELQRAGLSEEDIFRGQVTEKWKIFMKGQIKRARMFFNEAEKGVSNLNAASRWPVWASLLLYRQILDVIEANDYNNFTKRAYVGKAKKLMYLPMAYARALTIPS